LSRINDRRRLYPEGCNWGSMGPNGWDIREIHVIVKRNFYDIDVMSLSS
jgi:hypothetical protein